jgi:hypothetical protein
MHQIAVDKVGRTRGAELSLPAQKLWVLTNWITSESFASAIETQVSAQP